MRHTPFLNRCKFLWEEYIKLALVAIGDCEILESEFNFMTFRPSGPIYLIQICPSNVFWRNLKNPGPQLLALVRTPKGIRYDAQTMAGVSDVHLFYL